LGVAILLVGCSARRPLHGVRTLPRPQREVPSTDVKKSVLPSLKVRVAIVTRQKDLRLRLPRDYSLSGFSLTPEERSARSVTLHLARLSASPARVQTEDKGGVRVEGHDYLGVLEIEPDQGGTLAVVNEVDLEDYVMGVLVGEVPKDWPLEALKAQAIAARTFAVVKRSESRAARKAWDLESHTLHQVYKGSGSACDQVRKAVLETRGKILAWKGAPIAAFYHSNCGGRTCRASDVWGGDLPYLRPAECRYCRTGPHYDWESVIPVEEVSRKVQAAGLLTGDVVQVVPLEMDESGRSVKVELRDVSGETAVIRSNELRTLLGPDTLRCTRFEVEIEAGGFRFRGKGWGHGVGLCQEGACGMAKAGFRAVEILRKYYTGALVEDLKARP